jgi:predicted dehydrogenase
VTAELKCAIVGVSGPRAAGHAEAYPLLERGRVVAVSSRRPGAADAFADRFGIEGRYADHRAMFERVRPDLVHVNTPPHVRLEILRDADAAGIAGVILEKPLGVSGEDYRALEAFARTSDLKVAVNHQLHFHPRRAALQRAVREGAIGEVRFVEASAQHNVAYQGTHMLEAIRAFTAPAMPESVFAQAAGADGLQPRPHNHLAPDDVLAEIAFDGGLRGLLRCGPGAPDAPGGGDPIHLHKRVAVYGTDGFVHWTMHGWEASFAGNRQMGRHDYADEDVRGQAALTEAMLAWLAGDAATHPLSLDGALTDFNLVLAIYASALQRQVCSLPYAPAQGLIGRLRDTLGVAA